MATLQDRFSSAQDNSFFPRVRVALAITAAQIAAEDPETPNHENRVAYARDVFRHPDEHVGYWMFALQGSPNFGTGTEDPADNDPNGEGDSSLLWTIASMWDSYAAMPELPPPPPPG